MVHRLILISKMEIAITLQPLTRLNWKDQTVVSENTTVEIRLMKVKPRDDAKLTM